MAANIVPQLLYGLARRAYLPKLALCVLFTVVLYFLVPWEARIFLLSQATSAHCNSDQLQNNDPVICNEIHPKDEIPNIAHFVYILSDPIDGHFPLQFSHYLSLYAAWHHWRPDIIYLHTNVAANSSAVLGAQRGDQGKWARLFFEMPGLTINTVAVPAHTNNGRLIRSLEHKSDFVRVQAIHDFGGAYIDLDVHSLKDIKLLRQAGYAAVGGWQTDGYVNSGTFLSEKGGRMIKLWIDRMHDFYDGGWTTHSNGALTAVSKQLTKEHSCEMLTLQPSAFAPIGWRRFNSQRLFFDHFEAADIYIDETGNLTEYPVEDEKPIDMLAWALDWRCTYLLHAFSAKKLRHGIKDNGITPRYIAVRRSNFARAVYPTLRHMYRQGLVSKEDLGLA